MDLVELGAFLKSRRDRLAPPRGDLSRRRVPGMRRDEVARLAGASVDYYVQLEQGRGAQPSEQMLGALARALRLDLDELRHVHHLAGRPVPPVHGAPADVHPGLRDLLDRLTATPAQVMTDLSVPLLQNRLAQALLGPLPDGEGVHASVLYRWFTDPAARARYHPDEHGHQSRVFVADLRAAAARRGDGLATALVDRLRARSAEFAALWARREVAVRRADRKRLVHPDLGVVELSCFTMLSEDGTQRLLWFTGDALAGLDPG